jgi:hypothetical protein
MSATTREIDFSLATPEPVDKRPRSASGKLLTDKQIRARLRRRVKRMEMLPDDEFASLYKPVEEWDLEELARGRPRNRNGRFTGPRPKWITREVHEKAMQELTRQVRAGMHAIVPDALKQLHKLVNDEQLDERGKPIVPASTKADIAKFLLEHVVGKPTQRVETDLSVKLQGILGAVMVNPGEAFGQQGYAPAHLPGVTMALGSADDEMVLDDEDIDG